MAGLKRWIRPHSRDFTGILHEIGRCLLFDGNGCS